MAAKQNHVKTLSALEVEERMEMGLCLLCDQPFTLDHQLKHKRMRFVVMEYDEDEYLQVHLNRHTETPLSTSTVTNQEKSTDLTHIFFDTLMSGEDDTEKSHGGDEIVPSLVSEINTEPVSLSILRSRSVPIAYMCLSRASSLSAPPSSPVQSQTSLATVDSPATGSSPRPNSEVREYEYESPKLPWFWVKQLRVADQKLDWEKLKRSMSEVLLLNTPSNKISNATMRTSLLDSSQETYLFGIKLFLARIQFAKRNNPTSTSPPTLPDQYFQWTKLLFKVFHYHFLIKDCDSNCVWIYYDEMAKWLLRVMQIYILNCVETNLFLYCVYHDPLEDHDYSFQLFDQMSKCHVAIWNAIISRCMHNELENVAFKLFKDMQRMGKTSISYLFSNILILCSLKLLSYGNMLVILVSLHSKGMIQSLMCKYMLKRVEALNALIKVSNYQFLKVNKLCSKTLLPTLVDRAITNKSLPRVISNSSSCKWEFSTLVEINVAGGKLSDASSICQRWAWQLQQLKHTLELMALSLKYCVLNLESQGVFTTKSVNWNYSQLPKDFYGEQEMTFMRDPKMSNNSLEFEYNMMLHILYFISLFLYEKFKKYFKGVSDKYMKLSFYSMDIVKDKPINKQNPMSRSIGELAYKHLIPQRFEANEVKRKGSRIVPEFPSLQKELNSARDRCFYVSKFLLSLLVIFGFKNCIMNVVSEQFQSLYLIALCSSVGTSALVQINNGKHNEVPNIYGPMVSYWSCVVLTKNYQQVTKSCASLSYACLGKENGDERVEKGESLLKEVPGKNVVLFKNLELNSLKRQGLKSRRIPLYYENEFIAVLMFECEEYYVLFVLHMKMNHRRQVMVLQSLMIFQFSHVSASRSLTCNFIYIMLAIAVCVNKGTIVVTKIMLKWRDLPPKHGTWEFDVDVFCGCS